jgi:hypothetical protein
MKSDTKTQTTTTGLKVRTSVRAGGFTTNHNQTVARGLKVRTSVRAGGFTTNHNQTATGGLKVRTNVRAGLAKPSIKPIVTCA